MLKTAEQLLQRSTPERQGIASSAVLQFVQAVDSQIHECHSFMLLRHGKVIAEGWWSPYEREHPHMLFSLSKSFTSTAVGMAVAEGRLSIDDTVLSFFPDEAPAEVNEHLAAMQGRHLLSMSTGHPADTMPHVVEQAEGNWVKGFFEAPVVHKPGTHFFYNTGATYMQSAIVQKVTGMKLIDYLTPRLFEPLGIENATWQESPQGINIGGFGLNIKTEDIAKFGQLYLQKGMWGDRRLLPEAWIEAATSAQISNGDNAESDWTQGYGYQFWRCRHDAYRGDGAFGQFCVVMPEQDAVLAITAGVADMQQPLNLVWDILLPAMQANSLPEDAQAQDRLAKKLSTLNHPPVQGKSSSPLAAKVSGQTYQVDKNDLNVETVTLNFAESGCTVTVKTGRAVEKLPCGYSTWQPGQTTLFNAPWAPDSVQILSSGAWTAEATFTTLVRLYETSFFYTIVYRFAGDKLTVESRVNVGFEPPKTITLTGHSG